MTDDTRFIPGDQFGDLLRKILTRLNQLGSPASTTATAYRSGDLHWAIARKILARLNELTSI